MIKVGVFDDEQRFLESAVFWGDIKVSSQSASYTFHGLSKGHYAVSVYHDENSNGELDANFIGIPSEPYAFSQKPKSKWRLPKFHEVKFDFTQSDQRLKAKLSKWWD